MNNEPNVGWLDTNSSVTKSFSPILDMKTLYFADAESIHIAYSVDGDRYTGEVKLNLVATDPLVDVVI